MVEPTGEKRKGCGCAMVVLFASCSLIVILAFCFWYFRWLSPTIVSEDFETGDTGWLVMGDAQGDSDKPTYETEGGNPGAHMSAIDNAVGGVWYWSAPDSFLNELARNWKTNGSSRAQLTFDLKQSALDEPFDAPDVILGSGDFEIHFMHAKHPGLDWTRFRVPLKVEAGWINSTSKEPATVEEMERVMNGLDKLWIRGEFRTGNDTGGIDNISIR